MASERKTNARPEFRELDASELDHATGGGTGLGGGGAAGASLVDPSVTIQLYPIVIGGQPPPFEG